jgi:hypothetical protein
VLDPTVLGRLEWEHDQAARDMELLGWVERFRFVTPEQIATRFGVSWQRANARVRRLERVGLLGTERSHVSQPRAVFVTGRHDAGRHARRSSAGTRLRSSTWSPGSSSPPRARF